MPKIAIVGLLAGVAFALSPTAALADPDDSSDGGGGGRAYPCPNGQFWYPQFNQCVVMCKPGFDHSSGPDSCDKIPTTYRDSYQGGAARRASASA
ncbi:MAG: rDNA silencing protein [Segniliparus sp.]|uniref:rDNA silencing protein n=1 Tax=Segniliparus sp. TaxID=2804064 RepID=UPI003F37F738